MTGILLISCSKDDATPENSSSEFTDALPLKTGNYWTYDVNGNATTRDSLYISGDTLINTISYKKFKNKNNVSTGFFCTSVNNNGVRKNGGKLLLSGDFSLGQGQTLPVGLDLNLSDFEIFNESAVKDLVLSEKSGTFNQDYNGTPLKIEYTLKSIAGENFTSFTAPDNKVYPNVKSTKVVLRLKVTTTQTIAGFPITVTVLQPQDVIVSTQYLSKNIGVVYTKTVTGYTIDAQIANNIGIPASNTQTQEEFLDVYHLN